jgi:hypothetical protein
MPKPHVPQSWCSPFVHPQSPGIVVLTMPLQS